LTFEEVLTVVRDIAECPTIVPNPKATPSCKPIVAQGKSLARLFAYASMKHADAKQVRTGVLLV
jgi:hypothetical protein